MNRGSIYFKNPWQAKTKPLYEREESSSFSYLMSEAANGLANFNFENSVQGNNQGRPEEMKEEVKHITSFNWLIELGSAQSYFVGLVLTTVGQEDSPLADHFIPFLSGDESTLVHNFSDENCLNKFCTRRGRLEALLNCAPVIVNLVKETVGYKVELDQEQFEAVLIEIYKQTGSAYLDVVKRQHTKFPYQLTHHPHFSMLSEGPQCVYPYAFCYRTLIQRSPVDRRWAALKDAQANMQLH